MSLLDDNIDCQLFVNKTVYEIVKELLDKYSFVNVEYPKDNQSQKIPYTVKYDESDAYFISRILQSQGISYFFNMENGKHTMKFYSDYNDYTSLEASCDHFNLHVNAKTKVLPAKIIHASFNYDQPNYDMTRTAMVSQTGVTSVYKHLPGHDRKMAHSFNTTCKRSN